MAKYAYAKGSTSVISEVFIPDSSSSTGAGLTGLVYNSAGLTAYYARPGAAAAAITLATQTVTGAYSSGGFVEIDATNMPGWYRLDIPDAVLASGVNSVGIHLKGATNMAPTPMEIQLTDFNLNSASNNQTGDSYAIVNNGTYGNAQLVRSTTPANTLDVNATGEAGIDLDNASGTLAKGTDITGFNDIAATAIVSGGAINTTGGAVDTVTDVTNLHASSATLANQNILLEGLIMQSTTIATLASQTSFTLTAGSSDDKAYEAATIVVVDSVTSTQKAFGSISGYTGSTKTVTLAQDPGVFTMAVGDKVYILPSDAFAIIDRALTGATHNVPTSLGRRARSIGDSVSGTVNDASPTTTSFITSLTGYDNDHFVDQTLHFDDSSLAGQSKIIIASDGTTGEFTFDEPWTSTPTNGALFTIDPTHVHSKTQTAQAIWDRVLSKANHNIGQSAGKLVRQQSAVIITDGTAQAGGANTITLDAGASATDNAYYEMFVFIEAGTGAGQGHHIVAYNGTTKVVTIDDNWDIQPDNTSDFIIYNNSVHEWADAGVVQAATANTVTLNNGASAVDNYHLYQEVYIPSGTGAGQTRRIIGYVGATKVATLDRNWVTNPTTTSGYIVFPHISPDNVGISTTETDTAAIKAKTDSMTFTKANELDVNVQSVNDVTIVGDGSATPFDV